MNTLYDVIIVGAGPAGIGLGNKFRELGINYLILEKEEIGSSFLKWNDKTKFISPSFPSNAFGQTDLNSIDYFSSPGFFIGKQNFTGADYAKYLKSFVVSNNINIKNNSEVLKVEKNSDTFNIITKNFNYISKFLCYATGEFGFPKYGNIVGKELSIHSSEIKNYDIFYDIQNEIPIIGGYESAIDLSYNLVKLGKKVSLFSSNYIDDYNTSDPSQILSLVSMERFNELKKSNLFNFTKAKIDSLEFKNGKYIINSGNESFNFDNKPILATGFYPGLSTLGDFVSYRDDGYPELNNFDELKKTKGIFVSGPVIRHDELIFCFIYKFRLRFGVVALEIAKRLGKNLDYESIKKLWEKEGFYLDEFSSCGDECSC